MLEIIQTLEGHTDRVWTLAWNPNGTILATSGADKTIRLWTQEDKWNCVAILTGSHNKSVRSLSWSPCGTYLASASFDSTVCIWRRSALGDWSAVVNLEGHESEVKCVAWSADGVYLASCGRDRTVWIWERAPEEAEELDGAENWDCSDVKSDHSKDVKRIVWHPHHPILVSCSYDDTIKFFHKENGDWTCFETLASHESTVWSADFSKSGEHLVTCSDDKTVRIWKNHAHDKLPKVESNSWKCISVVQGYHSRSIYDVSWSKANDIIASASGDNSLAVYQMVPTEATFSCVCRSSQSHDCDVNCVSWNPSHPNLLASGSDDRKIKLWRYVDEGTDSAQTIIDELMQMLSRVTTKTNNPDHSIPSSLNVEKLSDLIELIDIMQSLKGEVFYDTEQNLLGKLLDLNIASSSPCVIDITNLIFNQDGHLTEFKIHIADNTSQVKFRFDIAIDHTKFALKAPKRVVKMTVVDKKLFIVEKTGDLYQVDTTGGCKFLLGHLFVLSDLQFITDGKDGEILYVITADRDEKIRITNWPNTFEIERFCFGHKHLVRRLIAVNESKFISIDQQDGVCLWNLADLKLDDVKPLLPEKISSLDGNLKKRICVGDT